LCD
jgi:hypothetical protein